MRTPIWRTLAFMGFFLFASFQLLPLAISIASGLELFPHWPLLAVGVGLLLYGCCLGGGLWLERRAGFFGPGEKGAKRLDNWLIALGLNALGETIVLFLFLMIVIQPLASWMNGTLSMEEWGISFVFLLAVAAGAMILTLFFWLSSRSGKQARKKE